MTDSAEETPNQVEEQALASSETALTRDDIVREARILWDRFWTGNILGDYSGKYMPIPEATLDFPTTMLNDSRWPMIKNALAQIPFKQSRPVDDLVPYMYETLKRAEDEGLIPKGCFNEKLQFILSENPDPSVYQGDGAPLAVLVDLLERTRESHPNTIVTRNGETFVFDITCQEFKPLGHLKPSYCQSASELAMRGCQSIAAMNLAPSYGEYLYNNIAGSHEYIINNEDGRYPIRDRYLGSMLLYVSLMNNSGNMLLADPTAAGRDPGCPVS